MNGTLTGPRATARVAPTIDDLAMPLATEYGRGDPRGRPGFDVGRPGPLFHRTTETPAPQDLFATTPMTAMRLEFDWLREEEAYTSFEAAISDRVLALKGRRIGMNEGAGARARGNVKPAKGTMSALASRAVAAWHERVWQRGLLFVGTALMLMLAGFDLMGWLVLYAR